MKTRLTLLFTLCLLVCIALPAVLLPVPTSSAGGQLTDIQGISERVALLESGFDWIKWTLAIGLPALLTVMGVCFTALFFAIRDTRQDIQKLETNTRQDIQKLDSRIDRMETNTSQDIKEIRTLLMQLIQNIGRQDTKQGQVKRQAKR